MKYQLATQEPSKPRFNPKPVLMRLLPSKLREAIQSSPGLKWEQESRILGQLDDTNASLRSFNLNYEMIPSDPKNWWRNK